MGIGFAFAVSAVTATVVNTVPPRLAAMAATTTSKARLRVRLGPAVTGPAVIGSTALGKAAKPGARYVCRVRVPAAAGRHPQRERRQQAPSLFHAPEGPPGTSL